MSYSPPGASSQPLSWQSSGHALKKGLTTEGTEKRRNKEIQLITDIAEGYLTVISGLGSSSPSNLLIIPFVFNNETIAIAELAAFEDFPENIKEIYDKINDPLSEKINALI